MGAWKRCMAAVVLLSVLTRPSEQGKFLKMALAASALGGHSSFSMMPIPIPVRREHKEYYPVHYPVHVPVYHKHHTKHKIHNVHHLHKVYIPVHHHTKTVHHKHYVHHHGHGHDDYGGHGSHKVVYIIHKHGGYRWHRRR
ncbi:uncharacterized protein LOC144130027 [Amblyomma americanum]